VQIQELAIKQYWAFYTCKSFERHTLRGLCQSWAEFYQLSR